MPVKKSKVKDHFHYHKDGTIWAKGQLIDGVMTGYWEWFRKDGTKMRPAISRTASRSANGPPTTRTAVLSKSPR